MDNSYKLAESFSKDFALHNNVFATAESCTGGLISACITSVSGSSKWFDRSFVTYTNEAKMQMLGVLPEALVAHGAVSEEVACMMASGAIDNSLATIAVAVTGIAGPTGGTEQKPVGTVCIAFKRLGDDKCYVKRHLFSGDRCAVRESTVCEALKGLLQLSAGHDLTEWGYTLM